MRKAPKSLYAIFLKAYRKRGTDRKVFLDEACHGDDKSRNTVETLLVLTEEPKGIFETELVSLLPIEPSEFGPGDEIGRYQVQDLIEYGNMGLIYKALHPETENTVAIKIARRERTSEHTIQRFLHERETLANLNHPNIARYLDLDITEEGIAYVAMEYVDGAPINHYCKKTRPGLAKKISFCEQICQAVNFAHKNLILHRDLKPANILVTPAGETKLVNFGLAWLIEPSLEAPPTDTMWQMTTLGFLEALQYTSPEQLTGSGPLTTSTDVYSLGVIFYEILTGNYPFQKQNKSFFNLKKAICTEDPERPSISAKQKPRDRLVGDLDRIVLTAMHKDPDRRYDFAKEIEKDLRRHREVLEESLERT